MACFIVPATEAVITTVAAKILEKKENQQAAQTVHMEAQQTERFSKHLNRLNGMLWGGSALLAFEHVWHGEIQAAAPFLTAAQNPADLAAMLHEMSTVGVGMAFAVTAAWAGITAVLHAADKKETTVCLPEAQAEAL